MKPNTKVLIVCKSTYHGNTLKVAKAIAHELEAEIKDPSEVSANDIDTYEVIGFGSGIYNMKNHADLFTLVDRVKAQDSKKAFVFSTSGAHHKDVHRVLKQTLDDKGFVVMGEFTCRGFVNHNLLKFFFGGFNKNRPNEEDLEHARKFANDLKEKI